MKIRRFYIAKALFFFFCFNLSQTSFGQGRIVINEYMPWTLNGCGATSEFVELLNFGPGPINIGCYILTDGDYSVTIPPNTILQPGEFYVIAGQATITVPCGNIDSTISVDLNWNTCGCTSGTIPTTGDGFFTDGGSANEQVVFLDPNLNVVDAVARSLPVEPSGVISTSSVAGGCSSQSFDLDTMNINYEIIGESAGRGNSFARKLDGDCGWVKDPQQSANATNNTSGDVSAVSYSLTIVKSMDCDNTHGSVNIYVDQGSASNVFPMNYTVAFDSNGDDVFNFSDNYTYGVDSTASSIDITNLVAGKYKITVGSASGCYLKTLPFSILACLPPLPSQLVYFKYVQSQNDWQTFEWQLSDVENIQNIILEKSTDGSFFIFENLLQPRDLKGIKIFTQTVPVRTGFSYYRLRLNDKTGNTIYSPVVKTKKSNLFEEKVWPNPINHKINVLFTSAIAAKGIYKIYNITNTVVKQGVTSIHKGINNLHFPLPELSAGIYQLFIITNTASKPILFRFVKH